MTSRGQTIARLYGPVVIAAGFCLSAIYSPHLEQLTTLALQPFDLLSIELPLPAPVVARGVLILAAFGSLATLLFQNYASLFPEHFKMEVFFDAQGLAESVASLGLEPVEAQAVSLDLAHRAEYFATVDQVVAGLGSVSRFFSAQGAGMHSVGFTSFVVEPVSGWQRYRVVESKGELQHTLELPGATAVQLLSFFEKIPSGADYFCVTRRNPFSVLLKSRFKQMLAVDRDSARSTFRFVIVGLTRVRIWPWPAFSNTVYCADFEGVGLVPIAYAVYR